MAQNGVKLFISHSSKTELNQVKLKKVCDDLSDAGFDVLTDQLIQAGDEWRPRLFEWMAECHAAIILMSVDAFDSSWVQVESTILAWRRCIDSKFTLICVLMDEVVSPEDMTDDPLFAVTRPTDYNLIRFEDIDVQLVKIKSGLGALANTDRTPFKDLIQRISDVLANLGANSQDTLQRAWDKLKCGDKPTNPNANFADALARLLVREPEKALVNLHDLLYEITQITQTRDAETLLEIIRGLWVSPQAASMLAAGRNKRQPAAINCQRGTFTGKSYARRAWAYPQQCDVYSIDSHASFKQDLDEAITRICFPQEDKKTALLRLKSTATTKLILLIFVYNSDLEINQLYELSQQITEKFRTISVVLATGPKLPDALPSSVTPITPALSPDEEDDQYINYKNIDEFIHQ
ncbi:MAG: toll/interleukin-1 receptor domain-containing protein [Thiohalomonadales bacterium]